MNYVYIIIIQEAIPSSCMCSLVVSRGGGRLGPDPGLQSARRAAGLDTSVALSSRGLGGAVGSMGRLGVGVRPLARRPWAAPAEATLGTAAVVEVVWARSARGACVARGTHAGAGGVGRC